MSKKTITLVIVLVGILTCLFLSAMSNAPTESTKSPVTPPKDRSCVDGLKLTATTDKATYKIGETVTLKATFTNVSDKEIKFFFREDDALWIDFYQENIGRLPRHYFLVAQESARPYSLQDLQILKAGESYAVSKTGKIVRASKTKDFKEDYKRLRKKGEFKKGDLVFWSDHKLYELRKPAKFKLVIGYSGNYKWLVKELGLKDVFDNYLQADPIEIEIN